MPQTIKAPAIAPHPTDATTVTLTQEEFQALLAAAQASGPRTKTWGDTFSNAGKRAGETAIRAAVTGAVSGVVGGTLAVGVNHVLHARIHHPPIAQPAALRRLFAVPAANGAFVNGPLHPGDLNPPQPWVEPIPQPAPESPISSAGRDAIVVSGTIIGGALGTFIGPGWGNAVGVAVGGVVAGFLADLF